MTRAGDDAERSDEEERRSMTHARDDAERSDEEERRSMTRARDDAERSDEEERRSMTHADKPGMWNRTVKLVPALLVLLVLVCSALTAWLYFSWYRPDKQTGSHATTAVIDAAREGTVAMLTYAPETVDSDVAAARSHLTGNFLSYYETFSRQVVAPASKQKALKTTADVVGAAVADLHPDSAVVLVFVNQTTTSKEHPDPAMAARSVQVSLSKVDGDWLIAKFDPV